ncbi:Fe2+-enterobactin ABC transporter substrate-binding protein [Pseudonocardia sp. RS010]|uniref:Fe2+-enterobactin ABC transporter substrate-binding protein n=1 Tax=Pseudonocardia sp. RS010 TaxID=3385979 RepID=UPI0039A3DCE9
MSRLFRTPRRRGVTAPGTLTVLTAALVALAGCSSAPSSESSGSSGSSGSASAGPRTIQTEQGPVEVPASPQRIVNLSGGLGGYLYAVDAPVVATDTRVLGVTDLDGGFPPAWADQARAANTQQLPGGEQLNIEAVAAAEPDLIIGGGQGITAVQAKENYDQLSAIAPTVLVPPTVSDWREQLRVVAGAVGRGDRVDGLIDGYDDKLEQVKGSIQVPAGPSAILLSLPNEKPYLVPETAALPQQLAALGFTMDGVLAKAGNPQLYGSGDSFEVSPELLGKVADAPNLFVITLSGRTVDQLEQDPLYAALPAFRAGTVHELPATSYRPDLDGATSTLTVIDQEF